ncbi:hypothetical protein T484DRAFT_1857293 [Baffinella frigidus]|nr:hypothetical protein T484DRAFT_1857293 [Cryptophyta sp. CCMP2293]
MSFTLNTPFAPIDSSTTASHAPFTRLAPISSFPQIHSFVSMTGFTSVFAPILPPIATPIYTSIVLPPISSRVQVAPFELFSLTTNPQASSKIPSGVSYTPTQIEHTKEQIRKTRRVNMNSSTSKYPKLANNGKVHWTEKFKKIGDGKGLQRILYYPRKSDHFILLQDIKKQAEDLFADYDASGVSLWPTPTKKPGTNKTTQGMTLAERKHAFVSRTAKDYSSWWYHQTDVLTKKNEVELFKGILAVQV